jgi:hypothetical protein
MNSATSKVPNQPDHPTSLRSEAVLKRSAETDIAINIAS